MWVLNVASLFFGVVAIIIPMIKNTRNRNVIMTILSFTCCLIAIGCQMVYQNHLVNIGDWSAIADTYSAVLSVSIVLMVITVSINLFSYLIRKKTI